MVHTSASLVGKIFTNANRFKITAADSKGALVKAGDKTQYLTAIKASDTVNLTVSEKLRNKASERMSAHKLCQHDFGKLTTADFGKPPVVKSYYTTFGTVYGIQK